MLFQGIYHLLVALFQLQFSGVLDPEELEPRDEVLLALHVVHNSELVSVYPAAQAFVVQLDVRASAQVVIVAANARGRLRPFWDLEVRLHHSVPSELLLALREGLLGHEVSSGRVVVHQRRVYQVTERWKRVLDSMCTCLVVKLLERRE